MDSRAHIQPHSLGVVKVPLSIPMKASPGLAGSGENPHVSPGSVGQGLGAWRGEQALMGEEWQAFLSWWLLGSPTRDTDLGLCQGPSASIFCPPVVWAPMAPGLTSGEHQTWGNGPP